MSDVTQSVEWPATATAGDLPILNQKSLLGPGAVRLRASRAKRVLDLIGASTGILILAPVMAAISLAIVSESKGPVLFRQRRTGLDGGSFVIYKFRTMRVQEDGVDVVQATRNDGRVTLIGRFLRRASIDELPQLFNVLKGEMSLVGPRPHAVAHDEYYAQTVQTYHLRFNAKPGITGLAQVSGYRGEIRDIEHMRDRVAHDIAYIEGWSFKSDLRILLRTVIFAPFDRSAY